MNEKKNKYLTEAMGMCRPPCFKKCRKAHSDMDFSTWPGFGILWEWATQQEWWHWTDFRRNVLKDFEIVHPDRFSDALYAFLKSKEPREK